MDMESKEINKITTTEILIINSKDCGNTKQACKALGNTKNRTPPHPSKESQMIESNSGCQTLPLDGLKNQQMKPSIGKICG
jgi:hypothetical protein